MIINTNWNIEHSAATHYRNHCDTNERRKIKIGKHLIYCKNDFSLSPWIEYVWCIFFPLIRVITVNCGQLNPVHCRFVKWFESVSNDFQQTNAHSLTFIDFYFRLLPFSLAVFFFSFAFLSLIYRLDSSLWWRRWQRLNFFVQTLELCTQRASTEKYICWYVASFNFVVVVNVWNVNIVHTEQRSILIEYAKMKWGRNRVLVPLFGFWYVWIFCFLRCQFPSRNILFLLLHLIFFFFSFFSSFCLRSFVRLVFLVLISTRPHDKVWEVCCFHHSERTKGTIFQNKKISWNWNK